MFGPAIRHWIKLQACFIGLPFLILAGPCLAQAAFPNSGFEDFDKTKTTHTAFWKPESENFECKVDDRQPYKGKYALRLESKTEGHHFFNEEFEFAASSLHKFKLRCAIKTHDLQGKLQLGVRLFDVEGKSMLKTMVAVTENPDQAWTTVEVVFVAEKNARKIRVFGDLFGTGEAWFDEFSIEQLPAPTRGPSDAIALYIHEYFDIVYEHSVIADKDFIVQLKNRTMQLCGDSIDLPACHNMLTYYTTPRLNDGHSFFTNPAEWKAMMGGGVHPKTGFQQQEMPSGKMLPERIGYLKVPMFISSDPALLTQYATKLHELISAMDLQDTKGYIIDISQNGGGNSFPMIAGLGPFLGDGTCGYSLAGNGSFRTRIHDHGRVGWDDNLTTIVENPYSLKYPGKPIAVIYSNGTGSSGEVVAIAFVGLAHARSFGQPTAGATTTVSNFELRDGAYLNLASGYSADRNKRKYDGPVTPDVPTPDTDTAIAAAKAWILKETK